MKYVLWILNCYPLRWRERYGEEMLALLEQHEITLKTVFDLFFGAIDARLDPTYATKEGFMFLQRIRDVRSLSALYLCMLASSLFLISFWLTLGSSLAFQDNTVGSLTNMFGALCLFAVFFVSLIALFGISGSTIVQSVKERQWGSVLFAFVCLALALLIFPQLIAFPPSPDFPLLSYLISLLYVLQFVLLLGMSLFITGVKGMSLLRKHHRWPLFLALLIDVPLPVIQFIYDHWGKYVPDPGTTYNLMPGQFIIGNVVYSSVANFLAFLLLGFIPYFALGALLLTLANDSLSTRIWRATRIFGVIMTFLLILGLGIVVTWDINRWVGGHVWIFEPKAGVWPLFGGYWIGPLITNVLILAVTVIVLFGIMIRSFILQPEGEHFTERKAA